MSRFIKFITRPWRTRAHMRRSMEILRGARQTKRAFGFLPGYIIVTRSFDPSRN